MTSPTPELDRLIRAEPDLVDRIFDYILSDPALARAIAGREEEMRQAVRWKVGKRSEQERNDMVVLVLSLFNGRNASEVARRLQISRATVYRVIKQAHQGKKQSQA